MIDLKNPDTIFNEIIYVNSNYCESISGTGENYDNLNDRYDRSSTVLPHTGDTIQPSYLRLENDRG